MSQGNEATPEARFAESMADSAKYPTNLIRTSLFDHSRETYKSHIDGLEGLVFSTDRKLSIIELLCGEDEFIEYTKKKTPKRLDSLMSEKAAVPRCRYIFIESESNRSPLGCTRAQLGLILSYHQVSPFFLDILLTFRQRQKPSLFTMFRHENHLSEDNKEYGIPSVGRSGVQLEHCFNLLSVEQSEDSDPTPWRIRQAAAYSSFDVVENRSTWIILKGNNVIRRRVSDAIKKHRDMKGSSLNSRERSLRSALAVHLLIMQWSTENWHPYIDHLDQQATKGSKVSGGANVDQAARELPVLFHESRSVVMSAPTSRQTTFNSRVGSFHLGRRTSSGLFQRENSGFQRTSTGVTATDLHTIPSGEHARNAFAASSRVSSFSRDPQSPISPLHPQSPTIPLDEYDQLDKVFNFEEVQRLNSVRKQVAEAIMAVEQNQSILQEIREHYGDLQRSKDFRRHVDMASWGPDISRFLSHGRSLERELEKALSRLRTLLGTLDSELQLRYGALQFQSAKWGEHFLEHSQLSAERMADWTKKMHDIAASTEQETASMHFITVLTLIFLPGTFLATLFSSGILHWNEDAKIEADWKLRKPGLWLFLEICVPMMLVVMFIWIAVYKSLWKKVRLPLRWKPADSAAGAASDLEKGQ